MSRGRRRLPEREFLPPSEVPVQVEGDDEGHE
jgi:hypothetical protein